MSDLWVIDASPLIVLGKTSQLELLNQLPKEVVVHMAVASETLRPMQEVGWRLDENTIREVLKGIGEDR